MALIGKEGICYSPDGLGAGGGGYPTANGLRPLSPHEATEAHLNNPPGNCAVDPNSSEGKRLADAIDRANIAGAKYAEEILARQAGSV